MRPLVLAALLAGLLAGCDDGSPAAEAKPGPVSMTAEAVGYFCQMNVLEHPGPKAQIHLAGLPEPLWFPQVRDAIAFLKSPEKVAPVRAVYVSDMGRAPGWPAPGPDNWVDAAEAHFVVGASTPGGMGAPEIVPFAQVTAAEAFAGEHGGTVMTLAMIPAEAALGAVDLPLEREEATQ